MSEVTTWEQAAFAASMGLPDWASGDEPADTLEEIEGDLNVIRRDGGGDDGRALRWRYVAAEALSQCEATIESVVDTIISKQHDYGHQNILWGGVEGIVIRAHDKVARIRNLLARDVAPDNESLEDSWLDIVGYALIGIMLENGTFELPLATDVKPTIDLAKLPAAAIVTSWPQLNDSPLFDAAEERVIKGWISEAITSHWMASHGFRSLSAA